MESEIIKCTTTESIYCIYSRNRDGDNFNRGKGVVIFGLDRLNGLDDGLASDYLSKNWVLAF